MDQVSTGDITDVGAGSGLATTDYLIVYDVTATATKKVLVSNTLAVWG